MADKHIQRRFLEFTANYAHKRLEDEEKYYQRLKEYVDDVLDPSNSKRKQFHFAKCCLCILDSHYIRHKPKHDTLTIKEFKKEFLDQGFTKFQEFFSENTFGIKDIVPLAYNLNCLKKNDFLEFGIYDEAKITPQKESKSTQVSPARNFNKENIDDTTPIKTNEKVIHFLKNRIKKILITQTPQRVLN